MINDAFRPTPGIAQQNATRMAFFIAGLGMAAWAPLVPYAKSRLGIDDAMLGLLLLCLGIGSIVSMPLSGFLAARFGCRKVIIAAGALTCMVLPFLAGVDTIPALAITLLLFGAGIGTIDVVINIQAVIVERAGDRAMMSGFHGLFSVGGIIGASGVSGLLGLGLAPFSATLVVGIVIAGALAAFGRHLLPYGSERASSAFMWPRGLILGIGTLCFITFLAEGAMLDWSAVFLTTIRSMDPSYSGLGYAAFAATMTLGRLNGDRTVRIFGNVRTLIFGGCCAAAGLVIAALVPSAAAALIGFALVGLGASNIVPVLYSTAGRQTSMPPHLAIASITTMGYSGILIGPAFIGFIADRTSLGFSFICVATLLMIVAISARIAKV